jgi:hypothetical protein
MQPFILVVLAVLLAVVAAAGEPLVMLLEEHLALGALAVLAV